jgi:hypothetical protein
MILIPIEFMFEGIEYKSRATKIPGIPVEYHIFVADPFIQFEDTLIYISDPGNDSFCSPTNTIKEFNDIIVDAIREGCAKLGIPVHQ